MKPRRAWSRARCRGGLEECGKCLENASLCSNLPSSPTTIFCADSQDGGERGGLLQWVKLRYGRPADERLRENRGGLALRDFIACMVLPHIAFRRIARAAAASDLAVAKSFDARPS